MVVGDDMTARVDEKPRPDGRLRRRTGFDDFDLDHVFGKLLKDLRRRRAHRLHLRRVPDRRSYQQRMNQREYAENLYH